MTEDFEVSVALFVKHLKSKIPTNENKYANENCGGKSEGGV